MAYYDWNHDGKIDSKDNYTEYQLNEAFEKTHKYTSRSGSGISAIGVSVAIIGGLFLGITALALMGCGDAPVSIIIIAWILCSMGLGKWFGNIGF